MGVAAVVLDQGQVVQRAREGDTLAFEAILDQFQTPICSFIYRLVGDREDAYDLTQDTFIKAYQALPKVTGDLNVSAWLYRIAANTAFDLLRRRRLVQWLPLTRPDDGEETLGAESSSPTRVAEGELIGKALASLSRDYVACLLLHDREGFSMREVGSILKISEGAARVKLFRARRAFRAAYGKLQDEGVR